MNFVLRYRELLNVPQPEPTSLSVSRALENVATLMKAECANVEVRTEVNPGSLEVFADSTLLDQVLVNLVKNALEAMSGRPNSKLTLGGRFEFGRVLISIADNGPGIDEETADEIFVPFFTTKREGSGIGLSLCRQIMTAHGGDIVIASDSNGTTANIIL